MDELGYKSLQKALIASNIIIGFKRMGIWTLNPDALVNDMRPSETFYFDSPKDPIAVQGLFSLSSVAVTTDQVQQHINLNAAEQGTKNSLIYIFFHLCMGYQDSS